MPALKYAIMINGVTKLFMTKSDVMSGFSTIKVCMSYKSGTKEFSRSADNIKLEPVYTELPGWQEDISQIRDLRNCPLI